MKITNKNKIPTGGSIMDTGLRVELLEHTPEPERLVSAAAKLCYSSSGVGEIMDNLDEGNIDKFLGMLMDLGHESPIEHVSFTYGIEGVSRSLTHQLVRHRIASYSQQSQRYVKLEQFQYIIPPRIADIPEAREKFTRAMEYDSKCYNELVDILYEGNLKKLLASGRSQRQAELQAEKDSIEDARYVFPNACETKIVVTMNARSLLNFFRHRCCNRAQWEIHGLADEMLKAARKCAPVLFKNAGPSCLLGTCPEGKMTCGRMAEVREKYSRINMDIIDK
jgi:thymidylate synthase (FAD)